MANLRVLFEGELVLLESEQPEDEQNEETIRQAVQDSIGFSGVKVREILEHWELP